MEGVGGHCGEFVGEVVGEQGYELGGALYACGAAAFC